MDYSPVMRTERADAARNRVAILDAAARLFQEHGPDAVSMDAIAAEAGVGKGTLFRRFGDRAGLAVALLDERERALQEAILSGPPPLGPGAPPQLRLAAFADAYLDFLLPHLELVRQAEATARHEVGAYRFWHLHVRIQLAGVPDPDFAAHALLASLSAAHVAAVLPELGEQRVRRGTELLARALSGLVDG